MHLSWLAKVGGTSGYDLHQPHTSLGPGTARTCLRAHDEAALSFQLQRLQPLVLLLHLPHSGFDGLQLLKPKA